jgi:hypothetical protein
MWRLILLALLIPLVGTGTAGADEPPQHEGTERYGGTESPVPVRSQGKFS